MAWRSIVCGKKQRSGIEIFGKQINYCLLAGTSFVVSDTILALTSITGIIGPQIVPEPISEALVHGTYFFAQYCFTKFAMKS